MNDNMTIKSNKKAYIGLGLVLIFGYALSFFMMSQLYVLIAHIS